MDNGWFSVLISLLYAYLSDTLNSKLFSETASELGDLLEEKNLFITTAESCTGGWVSKELTSISGSSKWFGCGFVTYSNISKNQLLGVSKETLINYGAVSKNVVEEMTQGALKLSGADLAIAISGIAGPSGGNERTPVGTVCLAWQFLGKKPESIIELFSGDRNLVRLKTVERAILGCLKLVKSL